MSRQLSFDLPPRVALEDGDFFVSDANQAAWRMVTDGHWPQGKLILTGPEGAGKSHLARVWMARTGALLLPHDALAPLPAPGARIAVEDADRLPAGAEEALFHLHNHLVSTGGRLLLTAVTPPGRWPTRLPDLASRMQATATIGIADPDDRLLFAVLAKHFADRQLQPAPDVVPWLTDRIERSFTAAARVVDMIDRAALAQRREITKPFVRGLLDNPGTPRG